MSTQSASKKLSSETKKCPRASYREAHIWCIRLCQETSVVEKLFDLLTTNERERAAKYHFQTDRMRFIIARGAVREILSRYLDIEPNLICFSYNRYGKPVLDEEINNCRLHFNVSRSQDFALCAVIGEREIGVDIEFINQENANLDVADRFFSQSEAINLNAFPENEQTAAFFRCWTRKEAYIKAVGKGFSYPIQDFSVSVGAERSTILEITHRTQKTRRWSLTTFLPHPEYVATIAVEGLPAKIKLRDWTKNL